MCSSTCGSAPASGVAACSGLPGDGSASATAGGVKSAPRSASKAGSCATKVATSAGFEPGPRIGLDHRQRFVAALRPAMRPVGHQRPEAIDEGDDARPEGDRRAREARRIPPAVPPLVMALDERRHGHRERHVADDVGAEPGVDVNLLQLFGCERPRLGDDVGGHGEHADVVQQRRGLDGVALRRAHPDGARQGPGELLHVAQVRVGRRVLGLDGEGERLDRRLVQIRRLLRRTPLPVEPAQRQVREAAPFVGKQHEREPRGDERRQGDERAGRGREGYCCRHEHAGHDQHPPGVGVCRKGKEAHGDPARRAYSGHTRNRHGRARS